MRAHAMEVETAARPPCAFALGQKVIAFHGAVVYHAKARGAGGKPREREGERRKDEAYAA